MIRELIKDLQDKTGDELNDCRTVPIVLGNSKTKIIINIKYLRYLRVPSLPPGETLCGQAEHLHSRGILPFDNEFLDEIALVVIQEKFGQGLT